MSDYLPRRIVILGMGGTIAGSGSQLLRDSQYQAAQLRAADLIAAVPQAALASRGHIVEVRQIAQLDSKDMDDDTWHALTAACRAELARAEVAAVLITHGTDTLEETAWFLHHSVPAGKPVVLTAAMRAADALSADGPANLRDALLTASDASAQRRARSGEHVLCVLAGRIHSAAHIQKIHPQRVDAFSSGEAGPLGWVEDGRLRWRDAAPDLAANRLFMPPSMYPSEPKSPPHANLQSIDKSVVFYPHGTELVAAPSTQPSRASTSATFAAIQAAQMPATIPLPPAAFSVDADLHASAPAPHSIRTSEENSQQNQSTVSNPTVFEMSHPLRHLPLPAPEHWPWVAVLSSHAGARAAQVDALVAAGVRGLVIAGTGNATVHAQWLAALARARAAGVAVRRCSRCLEAQAVSSQADDYDEKNPIFSNTYHDIQAAPMPPKRPSSPIRPTSSKVDLGRGQASAPFCTAANTAVPRVDDLREQARLDRFAVAQSASLAPFAPFWQPENPQHGSKKSCNTPPKNPQPDLELFPIMPLSAWKARISLMLEIMLNDLKNP